MNTYVVAFGITTAWLVGTEAFDPPIQPGVAYAFFYQRGGDAHLRLFWQWEDHPREPLPASALFHDERDAKLSQAIRDGKASAVRGEPLVMQAPAGDEADNSSIYRPQPPPARDAEPIRLVPARICSSTSI